MDYICQASAVYFRLCHINTQGQSAHCNYARKPVRKLWRWRWQAHYTEPVYREGMAGGSEFGIEPVPVVVNESLKRWAEDNGACRPWGTHFCCQCATGSKPSGDSIYNWMICRLFERDTGQIGVRKCQPEEASANDVLRTPFKVRPHPAPMFSR